MMNIPLKSMALLLLFYTINGHSVEPEIGGLVIDRTISRHGKDFYRHFSLFWQETPRTQGLNVAIVEKNIPRSGTVLWVEIQHEKIYQTFFGRRSEFTVNERAEQSLKNVSAYIASQLHQSQSPDLLSDGF